MIYRLKKDDNFTIISNNYLKDKHLSLKAKGLLTIILSLADDWQFSNSGLISLCKENKSAIATAIKELKTYGYLKIERIAPQHKINARFTYIYNVYESPSLCTDNLTIVNQCIENQCIENQCIENQCIYKEHNNKELNDKELYKIDTINQSFLSFIQETWNNSNCNKIYKMTDKRIESIKNILKTYANNDLIQAIDNIEKSDYLQGYAPNSKPIAFDWFIKPNNFLNVLENKYINNYNE